MTDPMYVPAHESGKLRLFTTDLPPEGAAAITAGNVEKLLGVPLEARKVEVVPSRMVKDMGLSAYLSEGYGISARSLEGRKAALDSLSGLLIFLPSSAFGGREATLTPNDGLRFVGLFEEDAQAAHDVSVPSPQTVEIEPGRMPSARPRRSSVKSSFIALGALIIAAALFFYFGMN